MGKLVIFDCDGVLVDSEVLVSEAESVLLGEVGVQLTPAQISEMFVGLSEAEMARRIHEQWGVVLDESFGRAKAERLSQLLAASLQPVTGMTEVVASVEAQVCVASSSSPERLRLSLERTGLDAYFGDHVFSASMVTRGKPAPDLFLLAAQTMGVPPERCVVVEDSPFGVAAGVAAGMAVVGFTGGAHCVPATAGRLAAAGAQEVVESAAQLGPALKGALAALA